MTNPHTKRVSSDTYQKAVKYLPEHWVMVLLKKEPLCNPDKPTYLLYSVIAHDSDIISKMKSDVDSKYDDTDLHALGTVTLVLIVTLASIKFAVVSFSVSQLFLVTLLFILTCMHMYVRGEVLRIKREYAKDIIDHLLR